MATFSIYRSFDISPSTNTGLSADLVFHYNINEIPENWDESNLRLFKSTNSGTDWTLIPSTLDATSNTVSATGLDGFSLWTLGESSEPLPVIWLEAEAERLEENEVKVLWSTASEINCESFEVQRSYNAADFESIASVVGSGNTNQISNYNIIDNEASDKVVYYRIKQIDYDGAYEYSKIMVVQGADISASLKVYPNPVADELKVIMPDNAENSQIVISDISGKIIYKSMIGEIPNIIINTSNWQKGIYFIRYKSQNEVKVQKIIKE